MRYSGNDSFDGDLRFRGLSESSISGIFQGNANGEFVNDNAEFLGMPAPGYKQVLPGFAAQLAKFQLQCQSQFTPNGQRPSRFEALTRWYSPDGDTVSPLKFIRIAEGNGLIVPVRDLGVMIALDDLGAGCSSQSYLQNLLLDALKIDQVVGERVETDAQLGRDEIQGFLAGRPSFDLALVGPKHPGYLSSGTRNSRGSSSPGAMPSPPTRDNRCGRVGPARTETAPLPTHQWECNGLSPTPLAAILVSQHNTQSPTEGKTNE